MKHLVSCLVLCMLLHDGYAQSTYDDFPQPANPVTPAEKYFVLSGSIGEMALIHPGQVFSTRFQYLSTSASNGGTTSHHFTGTSNTFNSPVTLADLAHVSYVSYANSFDFGVGLDGDMSGGASVYFKLGYGRIFTTGRWQIQPTLDLYWAMDRSSRLGILNNYDTTITILGFTADPSFTQLYTDDYGNEYVYTYDAGDLDVNYKRSSLLAVPKVQAGTILWRHLYVGIEAGWLQQLAQSSVIKLIQYDAYGSGASNVVGKVHLKANGSLTGPEFAVNVGWCIPYHPQRQRNYYYRNE
ncbi:MAG TPA: hypothetical protein VGR89_05515 [Puia sp.]|nr:hypothetical protein [Puia sp.]